MGVSLIKILGASFFVVWAILLFASIIISSITML
jgi:hypothetical protein